MNTKATIESVLGTLTTISFAIPEEGPIIAGGIAAFEFFFKLIYPDSESPPPPPPVDRAELQKELKDLLEKIIDAEWKTTSDQDRDDLLSTSDGLIDTWDAMKKLGVDTKNSAFASIDPHTQTWVDSLDLHTKNWINTTNTNYVANDQKGVLYKLINYQNHFKNSSLNDPQSKPLDVSEHRTAQTALLCLTNGLIVSYLKMVAIWEWGWAMMLNAQYYAYKAVIDDWQTHVNKNPAYATTHPFGQLQADLNAKYPYLTFAGYQPSTWDRYSNDPASTQSLMNKYVDLMIQDCVTAADGTDGLYTKMRKDWNALETMASGYDVMPLYPHGNVQINELSDAVSKGRKRAVEWKKMVTTNALIGVTEDDIDRFGKCIEQWRGAKASLDFYTYMVQAGDTMQTIANSQYSDSSLWFSICNHNWDNLTDLSPLPVGTQLKIYNRKSLPYVSTDVSKSGVPVFTYAAADGDTLIGIATSLYGDARLWPTIFYLNRGQLKNPNIVTAGMHLTLYEKWALPYVTESLYMYPVPAGTNLYTLAGTQYGDPNLWQDIVDLNPDSFPTPFDPEFPLAQSEGEMQLRLYKIDNLPFLTPWAVIP